MANDKTSMETDQNNMPAEKKEQLTVSEKFTNIVLREFGTSVAGVLQVTDYQRTLIQGYFTIIDRARKPANYGKMW